MDPLAQRFALAAGAAVSPVFARRKNIALNSNPSRKPNCWPAKSKIFQGKILRLDGFEPSTLSLKVRCSTTELKSRY